MFLSLRTQNTDLQRPWTFSVRFLHERNIFGNFNFEVEFPPRTGQHFSPRDGKPDISVVCLNFVLLAIDNRRGEPEAMQVK